MVDWKQYIFSILGCSLICGLFLQIIADTKKKSLIQMICGTVITIMILSPISRIDFRELLHSSDIEQISPARYIAEGKKTAMEAKSEAMTSCCETYILDRAKILGCNVTATVTLDENFIPIFVKIVGDIEPSIQEELENILIVEMGIPKENQEWIWNQENNGS